MPTRNGPADPSTPRTSPIYHVRRMVRRCADGAHVTGGQCGHAGGLMVGGSCYVPARGVNGARRLALTYRPRVDGSAGYTVGRVI